MRIYLAGPMRGIPDWNYPAFQQAATVLRELGHTVVSPHEADEVVGGPEAASQDMPATMRRDLDLVLQQEAVVLLAGWSRSHGACLERHAADVVGIPVFLYNPHAPGGLVRLASRDWRARTGASWIP